MKLYPGASVTNASAAAEINRTKGVAPNPGKKEAADGIGISSAFETLTVLNAKHAIKVAGVAAAVQNGTYRVNSAAVGKAVVRHAVE